MTFLQISNYFLQFFFIRLTLCEVITDFTVDEISFVQNNSFEIGGKVKETRNFYALQYFVLPFSGWTSDFIYIGKKRFLRIT